MFLTALLITAKTWKQLRCSSLGVWINERGGYSGNGMLFSTNKKWTIIKPWKKNHGGNVNDVINKRSQSEKATYPIWPQLHDNHSGKGKTMEPGSSVVVSGEETIDNEWSTEDF